MVERDGGPIRLQVARRNGRASLQPLAERFSQPTATVNTDEWVAYDLLPDTGRKRCTVKHSRPNPEYARDDDGDGVREVHCNTMEGIWTGARNFLRPFRGVSKRFLSQYLSIFEWSYNLKAVTQEFLQALLGARLATEKPP